MNDLKNTSSMVREVDPKGRYSIIDRVFGTEDGMTFLQKSGFANEDLAILAQAHDFSKNPILDVNLGELSKVDNEKLLKLFKVMEKNKELIREIPENSDSVVEINSIATRLAKGIIPGGVIRFSLDGFGKFYINPLPGRQYLFDTKTGNWAKVDTEPNEQLLDFLNSLTNNIFVPSASAL